MANWLRLKHGRTPRPLDGESAIFADEDGTIMVRDPEGTDTELGAGGNGGSQPSPPVAIVVTAAEIAARWDAGVAYVETDAIAVGDCCLLTAVVEDTLDGDTEPIGALVAYLPGASSADVDNGNDQLAGVVSSYSESTYSSGGITPDTIPYKFLNEGAAAYIGFSGTAPPTTGQVTVVVFRAT